MPSPLPEPFGDYELVQRLGVGGMAETFVAIKGFASAVLGGFGHIPGAMFAGLILGVTENLGAIAISYYYKEYTCSTYTIML